LKRITFHVSRITFPFPMNPENILALYVGAFVDELARAGVTQLCFCPGSRSTPLAMTFAADPRFKLWQHLDERSAAFFALGLAKAHGRPALVLCTSGSAAANFFPAIVEARYARVPLIVLTADRPPELRDFGAPQTIDQLKLFGDYPKWFVEMALPDASADVLRYARTVAARAVAESLAAPAGVVHLNFPFREPLVPDLPGLTAPRPAGLARADDRPYSIVSPGVRAVDAAAIERLAAELHSVERGLIIAGMQSDPAFPEALARLSAALGYPILADPLSQVRCGPHDRANVIDSYDAFLRDASVVERLAPEVVLRFGAMPTSKPVLQYLQQHASARQILIDGGGEWPDAARLASDVIHADPTHLCDQLVETPLSLQGTPKGRDGGEGHGWLATWRDIHRRTRQAVAAQVAEFTEPFEGRVFTELAACLPERATVFASSSMPVRDLDTFFPGDERPLRFLSNRGANGIDGVVSTALGVSAATGDPLVLVIGDLALYHDMNGLLAAKLHRLRATVILINNDGGGIFSFLPQAAHPEHFEQLFGTPHGLAFKPAAELYGATYRRVETWADFRAAVRAGVHGDRLMIVEMRTDRQSNVTMHRQVWKAVSAALPPLPERDGRRPG
jgi:2-succinyl-5-enolpyruvyl-6-hydroxy-3-cyclohexene-1-carboxylate synthase